MKNRKCILTYRNKYLLFVSICLLMSFQYAFSQTCNWGWAKQAGGYLEDAAFAVTTDSLGNVYTTGRFSDTAYFDNIKLVSSGEFDIFIAKYDSLGNVIWAKQAGGPYEDMGLSIVSDSAGNVYVTGSCEGTVKFGNITHSTLGDYHDIFLTKYDAQGNVVWAKRAGGQSDDIGMKVILDNAGFVYVTGQYGKEASFGNISVTSVNWTGDIFIAKYNTNGNIIMVKSVGGTDYDYGTGLAVDSSGNIYLAAQFKKNCTIGPFYLNNYSAMNFDILIAKFDASGNPLWAKKAGNGMHDWVSAIGVDCLGNPYITGTIETKTYFDNDSLLCKGQQDLFIAKYSTNGNLEWVKGAGGNSYDKGNSLFVEPSGYAYVSGNFGLTAYFGNDSLVSQNGGGNNGYVAKYDAYGNVVWLLQGGGQGHGIAMNQWGSLFVCGNYNQKAVFDNDTLLCNGYNAYLARVSGNIAYPTALQDNEQSDYNFYPNPAKDYFFIEADFESSAVITDLAGNIIKKCSVVRGKNSIDINTVPDGIYFIKIWHEKGFTVKKIVVN